MRLIRCALSFDTQYAIYSNVSATLWTRLARSLRSAQSSFFWLALRSSFDSLCAVLKLSERFVMYTRRGPLGPFGAIFPIRYARFLRSAVRDLCDPLCTTFSIRSAQSLTRYAQSFWLAVGSFFLLSVALSTRLARSSRSAVRDPDDQIRFYTIIMRDLFVRLRDIICPLSICAIH